MQARKDVGNNFCIDVISARIMDIYNKYASCKNNNNIDLIIKPRHQSLYKSYLWLFSYTAVHNFIHIACINFVPGNIV